MPQLPSLWNEFCCSHVSIIMPTAFGLTSDSPLMHEVESTTYTCYIVDLRGSPHEAPIPCAFKTCSIFSNKSKTLDVKNSFNDWYSLHSNVEPLGNVGMEPHSRFLFINMTRFHPTRILWIPNHVKTIIMENLWTWKFHDCGQECMWLAHLVDNNKRWVIIMPHHFVACILNPKWHP
jgi:hypothetical protein